MRLDDDNYDEDKDSINDDNDNNINDDDHIEDYSDDKYHAAVGEESGESQFSWKNDDNEDDARLISVPDRARTPRHHPPHLRLSEGQTAKRHDVAWPWCWRQQGSQRWPSEDAYVSRAGRVGYAYAAANIYTVWQPDFNNFILQCLWAR